MDMSPLPHKPAFVPQEHRQLTVQTPDPTPEQKEMKDLDPGSVDIAKEIPMPVAIPESVYQTPRLDR